MLLESRAADQALDDACMRLRTNGGESEQSGANGSTAARDPVILPGYGVSLTATKQFEGLRAGTFHGPMKVGVFKCETAEWCINDASDGLPQCMGGHTGPLCQHVRHLRNCMIPNRTGHVHYTTHDLTPPPSPPPPRSARTAILVMVSKVYAKYVAALVKRICRLTR